MTRRYFSKARLTLPFATPILTLDQRMKRRAPACRREATLWFRRIRRKTCARRMLPPLNGQAHPADDAALPLTLGAGYDLSGRCEVLGNLEFLGPPKVT